MTRASRGPKEWPSCAGGSGGGITTRTIDYVFLLRCVSKFGQVKLTQATLYPGICMHVCSKTEMSCRHLSHDKPTGISRGTVLQTYVCADQGCPANAVRAHHVSWHAGALTLQILAQLQDGTCKCALYCQLLQIQQSQVICRVHYVADLHLRKCYMHCMQSEIKLPATVLVFDQSKQYSGFPKFQRPFISIGCNKISVRVLTQANGSFVCHLH